MATSEDSLKWTAHARVIKYGPETLAEITKVLGHEPSGPELRFLEENDGLTPDEITEAHGNLVTTVGLARIANLIIGSGAQAFTNSRAIVGVGTSSTAATVSDVALGNDGTANARYNAADSSNPTAAGAVVTCNSTFTSGQAEFAWNEWCFGIATAAVVPGNTFATVSTSGIMLNRKVQSLGTKGVSSTWTLSATVTLS